MLGFKSKDEKIAELRASLEYLQHRNAVLESRIRGIQRHEPRNFKEAVDRMRIAEKDLEDAMGTIDQMAAEAASGTSWT